VDVLELAESARVDGLDDDEPEPGRVVAGVGGSDPEQGLEAAFVGREADLRLLKELFHAALERGTARLVAVFGEAGVGKSRLRREFSNYTDGLSQTVLWHIGRCLSYGEGVAYWALAEMVLGSNPSIWMYASGHTMGRVLWELGTPEQKARWLPPMAPRVA